MDLEYQACRRNAEYYLSLVGTLEDKHDADGSISDRASNRDSPVTQYDLEAGQIANAQSWAATNAADDMDAAYLCCTFPIAGYTLLERRLNPNDLIRWYDEALLAEEHLKRFVRLASYYRQAETNQTLQRWWAEGLGGVLSRRLGQAKAYINVGEPHKALKKYKDAIALSRSQRPKDAKPGLGKWIARLRPAPGESMCVGSVGIAYLALNDNTEALRCFTRAYKLALRAGDEAEAGLHMGNAGAALGKLGDYVKSNTWHMRSIELARKHGMRIVEANCEADLACNFSEQGDFAQALFHFEKARSIFDELGDRGSEYHTLAEMGIVYHKMGQHDLAQSCAEKDLQYARQIQNREREGKRLNDIANALMGKKQFRPAIEMLQQRLTLIEQSGDTRMAAFVLTQLATLYEIVKDTQPSLQYSRKAREVGLSANPLSPSALDELEVHIVIESTHPPTPPAGARQSLTSPESLARACLAMARGAADSDTYRQLFIQAIADNPSDSRIRRAFADVLDHAGLNEEAIPMLRDGLRLTPSDPHLANQLAWALVESGGPLEEAEDWLDVASNDPIYAPYISDTKAWAKYLNADYEGAITALSPCLHLANSVPDIAYHAGAIYVELGELDKARAYLKAALRTDSPFSGRDKAAAILARLQTAGDD